MEDKKKTGRPQKASLEQKKSLINAFFISKAGGDGNVMSSYNIYAQLAHFAVEKGVDLKAYDFKHQELKAHIHHLAQCTEADFIPAGLPAYVPLDIPAILCKNKTEISKVLRDREKYFEQLYKRAAVAIEQYLPLSEQYEAAKSEVEQLKKQIAKTEKTKKMLESEIRDLAAKNQYQKKIIRDQIEPAHAQAHMKLMSQKGSPDNTLYQIANCNVEKIIQRDLHEKSNAEKKAHLDISHLIDSDED